MVSVSMTRTQVSVVSVTDSAFLEVDPVFRISDLSGYAEFGYLFDSYSLDSVDLTFSYDFNSANTATGSASTVPGIPVLGIVRDYDDNATVGSEGAFLQYDDFTIHRLDKILKFSVVPRAANAVYNSTTTTGYSVAPPRLKVDCSNPNVPHYGIKYYVRNPLNGAGTTVCGTLFVYAKFHLTLYNPR